MLVMLPMHRFALQRVFLLLLAEIDRVAMSLKEIISAPVPRE